MKSWMAILCIACVLAPGVLYAADISLPRDARQNAPHSIYAPGGERFDNVIPRSPAAQSVWNSDRCWRSCERECNVSFQGRLAVQPSGLAIAGTDRCDRSCLRACRAQGGPFLNLAD